MWNKKQKEIDYLKSMAHKHEHTVRQQTLVAQKLMILVEGCTKHPSYRAVRNPIADCAKCEEMWRNRLLLNKEPFAADMGYVKRTGKRGPAKDSAAPPKLTPEGQEALTNC